MRRRLDRFVLWPVRWLWRGLVRVALSWLLFLVCLGMALRYLGFPVPSLADVLRRLEGVPRLADVLS
ncbi:MAG: hypothetical protein ACJ74W_12925 [Pyrinomonadaceae bacterium]